ncbi:hypothetical protein LAUMK136_04788 [Mycobacterium attenuatum]|uniref:SnoaL-like domain-containing protein n=1 Tax=Mycobacterium attenuatum TaxID=2341086 RepID=A0A498QGX8_9MYCO|nr:nuclear transport factor 2 family protein [Mycobacterium attenuatum]VBA42870.1 hypothetical protein LAUMK136_04788 [Mycobacterium attenuatum]
MLTHQSMSVGDVGGVNFDVVDRLAIMNLFGAYAYTYDQDRLEDFRELFTDSPELVLLHDNRELTADIDTVMQLLSARKANFVAEGNKRRHALNSLWFTSQSADEATGHCYVQVFSIRAGGPPTAHLTACYDFTVVKQQRVWRISRWVVTADQIETGIPSDAAPASMSTMSSVA